MKTNWSDYEMYLKPIHLKGKTVTLTIVRAVEEDTHPKGGAVVKAPVLYFRELPFGLILSPTNRQTLAALYGDHVSECIGKPIAVQSVAVRVGNVQKTPIRILNQRPNAPAIVPSTGEIVAPLSAAESRAVTEQPPLSEPEQPPADKPESELDKHFGPRTVTPIVEWPKTEAAYGEWLKSNGWNGKETYEALRADAKTWLRKNPSLTWADVAMKVSDHMSKVAK